MQCRELAAALTTARIEGPLRDTTTEEGSYENDSQRAASVRGALGQLLAWSYDAKSSALDAGLLSAIFDDLRGHQGALTQHRSWLRIAYSHCTFAESAKQKLLAADEAPSVAGARQLAFAEISAELRLLKNLLFHSDDAKTAAAEISCLHVLRGLLVLVSEHPEPRCTTQLLHVCAATVAHSKGAQTWWDERLRPTEHNGDARYVLNSAMRLAQKRQVQPTTHALPHHFATLTQCFRRSRARCGWRLLPCFATLPRSRLRASIF